jgi:hypothetical protein
MKNFKKHQLSGIAFLFAISISSTMANDHDPANFPILPVVASTISSSGDVNPYGVAFIPPGFNPHSTLKEGDVLVTNFNNSQNMQGTGSSIVSVTPHGKSSTFFQGTPGLGLTGALGILSKGLIVVGSMPTTDGTSATVQTGKLLVISKHGKVLSTITNPAKVNGPWGMAISEFDNNNQAQIFVSNVLNGTVVRFDTHVNFESLVIDRAVTIGAGYNHKTDPAALVLGPSGLNYDEQNDVLYVASSEDNAVYAIENAGKISTDVSSKKTGRVVVRDYEHLHGPLDLVRTPNGHFLVANSDGTNVDAAQPSEIVEYNAYGEFINQFSVDPNNGGAFGLSFQDINASGRFAFVNDNQNNITVTGFVAQ